MGSTSDKVKSAVARLHDKFLFWDRDEKAEEADLGMSDERELGRIIEAYNVGRELKKGTRFDRPKTRSVLCPGFFRVEETVWTQKLMNEVPSVGKHEIHYVNAAGYWLVLMDVAQKLAYDEETLDDDSMVRCLAFSIIFGLVAKRILTMRMDYYHLAVVSGSNFAAQMAQSVEAPMMEVESDEYKKATREYQTSLAQQVVKQAAKGEAARSARARSEGAGSAAGKQ